MSRHNIIGSEAFDPERHVSIRSYPRRGRGWRGYVIAGAIGGVVTVGAAGLLAYLSQVFGG